VGIMFSIYSEQTGGVPLWQETQNVQFAQGRYTVFLGETTSAGIPAELFASGQPRWLGVKPLLPGEEEQPRALLASVPYALKAVDADTLGGLPASAFLQANGGNSGSVVVAEPAAADPGTGGVKRPSTPVTTDGLAPTHAIPYFSTSTNIEGSTMSYSPTSGVVGVQNLENIIFPDQLTPTSGLCSVTGSDASAKIQCAINLLPAAGGVVDARNLTDVGGAGSTVIDPGSRFVTLYLGPTTYMIQQITLENGFRILGTAGYTSLHATATNALIVDPPSGKAIQHVELDGLGICGYSTANTAKVCGGVTAAQQIANCTTSQAGLHLGNVGVWYSRFSNLNFQCFGGDAIYLKNNDGVSINQFLTFVNVQAFRTQPASYALHVTGQGGQYTFINCEFDGTPSSTGPTGRNAGANIYIAATNNNDTPPYSVDFYGLTSQGSNLAVQLNNVWAIHFYSPHFENVSQGFYLTNGSTGVTVDSGVYITGSFVNGGAGFAIYLDSTCSATFTNNFMTGADQIWVNGGTLWAWNNISWGATPTNVGAVFQAKPPSQPAPACNSTTGPTIGGMINYAAGGQGVKDSVAVCAKDASGAWGWQTIF
jgi:hypothetical protein